MTDRKHYTTSAQCKKCHYVLTVTVNEELAIVKSDVCRHCRHFIQEAVRRADALINGAKA